MDFVKAMKVIKARKVTVISVAVLAFCLVAAAPKPKPPKIEPVYTSTAKLLMTPPSSNVRAFGGQSAPVDFSWFADPELLTELLRSEELLERISKAANSSVSQQELAYAIQVQPINQNSRNARLFKLSVSSKDPLEAQKLTRLVSDEFVRYVEDLSAKEFSSTRKFIEELVIEAEGRRDEAETALLTVREKYLSAPSDENVMMQARSIESRLNEVVRNETSAQAQVNALGSYLDGTVTSPPWEVISASSGSLGTLEANVADKKLELAKLRDIYTENNEKVQAAKRQLEDADAMYQSMVRETVESLYKSKNEQFQQMRRERGSLAAELNNLLASRMTEDDRRQVTKHQRELEVWEQNHLNLQQQLYQARVMEQSSRRQGSVSVLEKPGVGVVAYNPESMNSKMMIAPSQSSMKRNLMAIPFCLVLGIAAAFAQEYLTSSTKLRPRVEEVLEMPVLAVIPSTPSELTVDWESFKRPQKETIRPMVVARQPGSSFEERQRRANAESTDESAVKASGSSGSGFRFRNQK